MKKNIILILGPAGSGKSTQAKLISKDFKFEYLSESEILKEQVKKNTKLSKEIKKIMLKGKLIPYEVSCDLLFRKIDKTKTNSIIIDGFPRDLEQAITLDYYIYYKKYNLIKVLYIKLPKKESVKRLLLRKRYDDKKEIINKRLDIYINKTKSVIERYKKDKKLIEIDGNQTIKTIKKNINKEIKKMLKLLK